MKFNITIFFLIFNISLFSQTDFTLSSQEDVSKFQIGSKVFDLMSKFEITFGDIDTQEIVDQLKKLTSITSYSSNTLLGLSNIESSFNEYILGSELTQLIEFEEDGYIVNIYTNENEDSVIEEISMLVKKSNNLNTIYLQIKGEIDLMQIVKVVNKLDVPGGVYLKKLN
jgi:DUF438 domain-containing protein